MILEVYLDGDVVSGYVYNDDGKSYYYESGVVFKIIFIVIFINGEVLINVIY